MANTPKRRTPRPGKKAPPPPAGRGQAKASKLDQMIRAMRAPRGASMAALMRLTGWQRHSVRGAIAGALKKQRSLNVASEKVGDERVYRLVGKS